MRLIYGFSLLIVVAYLSVGASAGYWRLGSKRQQNQSNGKTSAPDPNSAKNIVPIEQVLLPSASSMGGDADGNINPRRPAPYAHDGRKSGDNFAAGSLSNGVVAPSSGSHYSNNRITAETPQHVHKMLGTTSMEKRQQLTIMGVQVLNLL